MPHAGTAVESSTRQESNAQLKAKNATHVVSQIILPLFVDRVKLPSSKEEVKMMQRLTRIERRGSEFNIQENPVSNKLIPWTEFTSDMKSLDREFKEVRALIDKFKQ